MFPSIQFSRITLNLSVLLKYIVFALIISHFTHMQSTSTENSFFSDAAGIVVANHKSTKEREMNSGIIEGTSTSEINKSFSKNFCVYFYHYLLHKTKKISSSEFSVSSFSKNTKAGHTFKMSNGLAGFFASSTTKHSNN